MVEPDGLYYAQHFYGYGYWNSPYWFVGMEEGGGGSRTFINTKTHNLVATSATNTALVDNYVAQVTMIPASIRQADPFFLPSPIKLQNYWKRMIRILLGIKTLPRTNDDIKHFQASIWGRVGLPASSVEGRNDARHAIIELMPFPSPGTNPIDWMNTYGIWTNHWRIPLPTREAYNLQFLNNRRIHIQSQLNIHKPKLVVFCGSSYNAHWDFICGYPSWTSHIGSGAQTFHTAVLGSGTVAVKTYQPGFARSDLYWDNVIKQLGVMGIS